MTFARVRALIFVSMLFVGATVVVVMAVTRDTQTRVGQHNACPAGLVPAKVKMPERNEFVVDVFNGTKTVGLAQTVGDEFKNRGFQVDKMKTAPGSKVHDVIAEIRYGPEAVGAARLVSAYFLVDEAEMNFDIKRKGNHVDVIIGTRFQQLATTIEVNQSIAALGNPTAPEGTCDAS